MKHLLLYESFSSDFKPEMISEQEYTRVKKTGIHLRFSARDVARLYTNQRGLPINISWVDGNSRGYIGGTFNQVIKNVELKFFTRFEIISIEKEDEPFVYFTINWGYRNSMISWRDTLSFPPDSKLYGRMEYEEFEMIREDAKLWKDFCVNIAMVEDRKTNKIIQESFGGSIPAPEPMSNREWTNEVTDAEEVPFNQKDRELFIALSDSISLENKYNQPTIARSSLSFNLINGLIDPKLRTSTIISSVTTYKNDDEFYYVAVWEKTYLDEKLYRCDGYECWEKFLKEIFAGYRELTKQTKTNESIFNEVPDPELIDVDEWDEEVTNAKEVDFNQREKELFIALADTIPSKHKINMPDIGDVHMSFSLVNGYGGIYTDLKSTTGISRVTTYKNEDEFYYMAVWEKGSGEKLYRCDGYECWEKFLKEIFAGYRELTKQTKTNESIFNEVPDPELIDVDEWDKVVIDKEIDFDQKEKEFFIDLTDTIPQNNNIDSLYIEDYQLSFSMSNGKDPIYPNIKFDDRVRSITSYKNDDEFYYVSVWEYDGKESTNELYRCDGYQCWEKFLKEIFEGYRKLTKTSQA